MRKLFSFLIGGLIATAFTLGFVYILNQTPLKNTVQMALKG
jgi:hypothetical protein